jgi:uridine kinase
MRSEVRIETYETLADRLLRESSALVRLVAVDGPGGAGKSFFAARLAKALNGAPLVPTDHFATGEPENEWFPRLRAEVLEPLLGGKSGRYRRYDWASRRLAEWHEVPRAPIAIVEGVSSARREIAAALALAVYITAPRDIRLERGLARDGEDARARWERWMAEEDVHFRSDGALARCDLIVDGGPEVPHDPELEFVHLAAVDRTDH